MKSLCIIIYNDFAGKMWANVSTIKCSLSNIYKVHFGAHFFILGEFLFNNFGLKIKLNQLS